MVRRKHPRELGFRLGLAVRMSSIGRIEGEDWNPEAKRLRDLVYVTVASDGAILKVGETGTTLYSRWSGILRLIAAEPEQRRYRANEWKARDRWREHVQGHGFEVWFKPAQQVPLDYIDGARKIVSLRVAEEDYLDSYYRPLIGKMLDTRRQES